MTRSVRVIKLCTSISTERYIINTLWRQLVNLLDSWLIYIIG